MRKYGWRAKKILNLNKSDLHANNSENESYLI